MKQEVAICENYDLIEKEIELKERLEEVSNQIADLCAERNNKIVNDHISEMDLGPDGLNQIQTWGLKKKLAPKNVVDPPAAKKDAQGELVTDKSNLEKLYLETYQKRLTPNPISADLKEL